MKLSQELIDEFDGDDEPSLAPHLFRKQRSRTRAARKQPREQSEIHQQIVELASAEQGHTTTYKPARYEEIWLRSSLAPFYEEDLIVDVLAQVKGGKEASVYRCQAHPTTGLGLVAAKVYRPRMFRNLRNDKLYRSGRSILTEQGSPVKQTDDRIMRAIGKKTDFGAQVLHTSWLMHEYTTLSRLAAAGAAVPRAISAAENAILMSYHGDEQRGAPTLSEIRLERREARSLFTTIMENIEIMLGLGLVHGDLSAYNILYWEGEVTIIDFPQVINAESNESAFEILQRDIVRVCEYFARQGVDSSPHELARSLWARFDPGEGSDEGTGDGEEGTGD